jgi:hypothetical protein
VYRINAEQPGNVEPLADPEKQRAALRAEFRGKIEKDVTSGTNAREKARAAYLAICLDFAPELKERHPKQWSQAIQSLASYPRVMQVIFYEAPFPQAKPFARRRTPQACKHRRRSSGGCKTRESHSASGLSHLPKSFSATSRTNDHLSVRQKTISIGSERWEMPSTASQRTCVAERA